MTNQAASIAAFLRTKLPEDAAPQLMIICGSGLGGLADTIDDPVVIPYREIEGFPGTLVVGHKGELVFGKLSGMDVMCMNGRFHSYEGHDMQTCTLPVRVGAHQQPGRVSRRRAALLRGGRPRGGGGGGGGGDAAGGGGVPGAPRRPAP